MTLSAMSLWAAIDQESVSKVRNKQAPAYIYRITLTDKQGTGYSLDFSPAEP